MDGSVGWFGLVRLEPISQVSSGPRSDVVTPHLFTYPRANEPWVGNGDLRSSRIVLRSGWEWVQKSDKVDIISVGILIIYLRAC